MVGSDRSFPVQLKGQIRKWEERAEEYEKVILKFRQRISDLNEEIQTQKDEVRAGRKERTTAAV